MKGKQHYRNISYFNRTESHNVYKHRDIHKAEICKDIGSGILFLEINLLKVLH